MKTSAMMSQIKSTIATQIRKEKKKVVARERTKCKVKLMKAKIPKKRKK